MTKKESEFSKALDDLEKKSHEINHEKKIRILKDKRLQETLLHHEKETARLKEAEERILKKEAAKNKVFFFAFLGILGITLLVPYYRRDPVNFWFYVVVALCGYGFWVTFRTKR